MTKPKVFLLLLFVTLAVGATGCSPEATMDPAAVAEQRSRLTLAEEPDDAQTVVEVRNAMFGIEESADDHDHDHDGDVDAHDHEHDAHDHEEADGAANDAEDDASHEGHDHAEGEHAHSHDEDEHDHEHDHAHDAKEPVVSEMDVVLVGSVGGVPNPSEQSHPEFPFAKGKAMFFLADPEAVAEMEEHEHKHAPGEECAFCEAHAGDSAHLLAAVQFAGEDGKTLPVDVRELFDLKEKETVVVRGKAKVDRSGMLVVDATGMYVRR